ncbi:MAG: C-GCAxxG-C-C family protein [Intestinimonas sp.]
MRWIIQSARRPSRDVKERHYNCCQAALLPFAEEQGLDHEDICRLAAQFGAGMRRGSVCGAATGGLMALGLLGADEETAVEFQRRFRARAGAMDCRDLLEAAQKQGEEKAPLRPCGGAGRGAGG